MSKSLNRHFFTFFFTEQFGFEILANFKNNSLLYKDRARIRRTHYITDDNCCRTYSLRSSTACKVFRWSNDNIKTSIPTISSQLLTLSLMLVTSAPALWSTLTQSRLPHRHASCIGVSPHCTEIRQHDSRISKNVKNLKMAIFL